MGGHSGGCLRRGRNFAQYLFCEARCRGVEISRDSLKTLWQTLLEGLMAEVTGSIQCSPRIKKIHPESAKVKALHKKASHQKLFSQK